MRNLMVLIFVFSVLYVTGQPSISGNFNPCPNVDEVYTLSYNPSGCSIIWQIWDGQSQNNGLGSITTDPNNPGRAIIRWSTNANGVARVVVQFSGSNCTSPPLDQKISVKAVGGLFPNITAIGGFPYCSQTVTLSVTNSGDFRDVAAWEWSIPSGWSFQGNSNSPVVTLNIPNGCATGVASVRARGGATCPLVSQHYSNYGGISLTRTPITTAIQAPYPNFEARCGVQDPATFRLTNVPSCGSVTWQLPAGWRTTSGQSGTIVVGGGFLL